MSKYYVKNVFQMFILFLKIDHYFIKEVVPRHFIDHAFFIKYWLICQDYFSQTIILAQSWLSSKDCIGISSHMMGNRTSGTYSEHGVIAR